MYNSPELSPVAGSSKLSRHGFRNPKLQISGSAATGTSEMNGLSGGTWVAGRMVIGYVHIDSQHLAYELRRVLGSMLGIS
jgi:hypothetical protein